MRIKNVVTPMVLVVVVSALLMTTTFAATSYASDSSARFLIFRSVNADLTIDSNGKAACTANAKTNNASYSIDVTMELIRVDTNSVVKTWNSSGVMSVRLTDQPWYVTSGHEYVVKVTAKAYSGTTLIETATAYSSTISY